MFGSRFLGTCSQLGQDQWVLEQSRKWPKSNRPFYFCDVGAGDPKIFSNSFMLERYENWHGLLIDVHPERIRKLKEMRTATVIDCAVSDLPFETMLLAKDPDFTYSSQIGTEDAHKLFEFSGLERKVIGKKLDEILTENAAPVDFEYLSIDIEGLEFKALKTINLDLWRPKLITIEHNYRLDRELIHAYLESFNYQRFVEQDTKWDDWYYRKDLVF